MPASHPGLVPFRPPLSSAGHPSLPGTSSELLFLVAGGHPLLLDMAVGSELSSLLLHRGPPGPRSQTGPFSP